MGLWLEYRIWDDEFDVGHLICQGRFLNGVAHFERLPKAPEIFGTPPPMDRDEAVRLARRSVHQEIRHRQYTLRYTSAEQDLERAGVIEPSADGT